MMYLALIYLKSLVPTVVLLAQEIGITLLVLLVIGAGLVMIFGAVGMPISNGLGATVAGAIFRAIGYIVRQLFRFIRWLVVSLFRLIPRIYRFSRRILIGNFRLNPFLGNLISVLITAATIAVII